MWGSICRWEFSSFLVAFLLLQQLQWGFVAAQGGKASSWMTLSGNAPAIIAKGGFSGLFPDSSEDAYRFALIASSPATTLWCDVQLTKDGIGICLPDLKLDNCTDIQNFYPEGRKDYVVNGVPTSGWFPVDYNSTELSQVSRCFSGLNKSSLDHGKPVIISHYGASGDYPDCTDLAYQKAVDDGADVIDCPVQVTRDGIPICMSSINLMDDTTVFSSTFSNLSSVIPELQSGPGIFTFNLTWAEIKALKPMISAPESKYNLQRNPRYKNVGNFMKLSDFLAFAKDKDLSGVLITVENAAFMAQKLGFSMTDAVIHTLSDAGYNNQTMLQVMIESSDSSVLIKFKQQIKYNLVYLIEELIDDATPSSLADIKKFADAVAVDKNSVFPVNQQFITAQTDLVNHLQNAGLSVYAYVLSNEFVSQAWDFFSDATVQINSYFQREGVDGIITDFVATARRYKRNLCMNMGNSTPSYMSPVLPGGLYDNIVAAAQPPALPPMPVLTDSVVVEPPLPPATLVAPAPSSPHAGAARAATSKIFMLIAAASCLSLCSWPETPWLGAEKAFVK